MQAELTTYFDYAALPTDDTRALQASAERIHRSLKLTMGEGVQIGQELLSAKGILPHGQFIPWIEAEFGFTDRTARNFMSMARLAETKSEIISGLRPTVAAALAAPSVSREVLDVIEQKVKAGENVTVADVKSLKALHRPPRLVERKAAVIASIVKPDEMPGERKVVALVPGATEPDPDMSKPERPVDDRPEQFLALCMDLTQADRDHLYHVLKMRRDDVLETWTGMCQEERDRFFKLVPSTEIFRQRGEAATAETKVEKLVRWPKEKPPEHPHVQKDTDDELGMFTRTEDPIETITLAAPPTPNTIPSGSDLRGRADAGKPLQSAGPLPSYLARDPDLRAKLEREEANTKEAERHLRFGAEVEVATSRPMSSHDAPEE